MLDDREDTLDVLLQTVQRIRADQFSQIPGRMVKAIIDLEVENEENPESAVRGIERLISDAAKNSSGSAGS